jgi:mono/diheme cytochrome c family protein
MSRMSSRNHSLHRYLASCVLAAVIVGLALCASRSIAAQEPKAAAAAGGGDVARGKYIVEDVAMCGTCHTPRFANGELDRGRWLAGASNPYLPAQPRNDWPIQAPRIAGRPPATDEQMITLLTTAVWTSGKQLDDPMPKFHMTRADAEAVLAYLKSLR